ncbi:hypothetical protein E4V01_08520 [Methylorubrum sp. Q1]|uniref:integrase family protein n=1 Tax=Methylorubrum sp. Q1 TaxID=2562453 RepID=UPI001075F2CE|nr:integrase family protein [Methylorubrum sp. Q1]TFZ59025.1 hypothetical protein E4V01_08520 [Methylorubrum sp. Q1]
MSEGETKVRFQPCPPVRLPAAGDGTKVVMPLESVTVVMTNDIVVQAKRYVDGGRLKGTMIEWRDASEPGLVLRLRPKSATWFLRGRLRTFRLGSVQDTSLSIARELCRGAAQVDRLKSDGRTYIKVMRGVLDARGGEAFYYANNKAWIDEEGTFNGPEVPMTGDVWTFHYLRKAFIEERTADMSPRWVSQYAAILHNPAFEALEAVEVPKLCLADFTAAEARMKSAGMPKSMIWRTVCQTKAMMEWALCERSGYCGFKGDEVAWWSRWKFRHKTGSVERSPTVSDLARTLVLVEHLRDTTPPGRRQVAAGTVGALWAIVLTAQRIAQLVGTPANRIFDLAEPDPDWRTLNWTADEMKSVLGSRRPHALPVPEKGIAILEAYRSYAEGGKSRWLFPSGQGVGHVSSAGVEGLLRRLRGVRYKRRPKAETQRRTGRRPTPRSGFSRTTSDSLFAKYGIEEWTPHDVRRSLATFLDEEEMGGAGSAILAHADDRKTDAKMADRMMAVTRLHYSKAQRIPLKMKGMRLWTEAVFAAYEHETKTFGEALRQGTIVPLDR